jgi:hemerythrin-like metal-binding protein
MPLFEWNDAYSVDIKSIDDEHKVLFNLINQLYDSIADGSAKSVLESTLNELREYTKNHFRREEFYFERINYPMLSEHKLQHSLFVDEINKFSDRLDGEDVTFALDLIKFLRDWLIQHIQGTDLLYVPHFKEYSIE